MSNSNEMSFQSGRKKVKGRKISHLTHTAKAAKGLTGFRKHSTHRQDKAGKKVLTLVAPKTLCCPIFSSSRTLKTILLTWTKAYTWVKVQPLVYIYTYLARHPYIDLGLAIVFLSCGACKPEQTWKDLLIKVDSKQLCFSWLMCLTFLYMLNFLWW